MGKKKSPLDIVNDIIIVGMENPTTEVRKKLSAVQRKMLNEGMHNGAQGLRVSADEVTKRTHSQAEACASDLKTLIDNKLKVLKENENFTAIHARDSTENLQTIYHDLGYLNFARNYSNDSQDILSLATCLLLGLFLIVADIALALQLVLQGFAFKEPKKEWRFENLVSQNWLEVLKHNWQVVLVTLGIAVFTVMLKIGFDRFLGTAYGAGYVRKARFVRWFKGVEETDQQILEAELNRIRRYEKVKNGAIILFVGLTVVFLFLLAQFRTLAQKEDRLKQQIEARKSRLDPNLPTDQFNIEMDSIRVAERGIVALKDSADPVYEKTFFGITLLFPVISAICLSIVGAALENRRKRRTLKRAIKAAKKKQERDHKLDGQAKGKLAAWELEKTFIDDPGWIKNFAAKLKDLYDYGFSIGNIRPDLFQHIPDMYRIIERYRDKMILFKTNDNLRKFNTDDDPQNTPV